MKRNQQRFYQTRENVYIGDLFVSPTLDDQRHHRPINQANNNTDDTTQVGHTGYLQMFVRDTGEVTYHHVAQSTAAVDMVYNNARSNMKDEQQKKGIGKSNQIKQTELPNKIDEGCETNQYEVVESPYEMYNNETLND